MRKRILIVEDHAPLRVGLRRYFETKGFLIEDAPTLAAARETLKSFRPDIGILDVQLPDGNGVDLLKAVRHVSPEAVCVMVTGEATVPLAVRALKAGANDFLQKPLSPAAIHQVIRDLLPVASSLVAATPPPAASARPLLPFLGTSDAIRKLEEDMTRLCRSDSPLLLLGETGTGKSVLARWAHAQSPRAPHPFVEVNCAGLTRDLAESELFGHERGAFTGAQFVKQGLVEMADQGTLFLDEIGDLDPSVQPKLLKAIEEHRFRRVGDVRERTCDLRLVAATHHPLSGSNGGAFRSDLYYRISTLCVTVPPLRERREDVPHLAREILEQLTERLHRGTVTLSSDAEALLLRHTWPGNIRELRNVLESALCMSERPTLTAADFRIEAQASRPPPSTVRLEDHERLLIHRALEEAQGSVYDAAKRLGMSKSTLYERLKRYALDVSRFRPGSPARGHSARGRAV